MKKKILFVMESLGIGGAEKSLVTLLSLLDKEKYDISLYLFKQKGEFLQQLPDEIRLIPVSKIDKIRTDFKVAWIKYLIKGEVKKSFCSLCWLLGCCYHKYIKKENEYIGWKYSKSLYSDIDEKYDVAIAFLEKATTYFVVDHVKADKRIAFMHTDYDAIPHDQMLDEKYYRKYNYLAVVSEHTKDTMIKYFPFMGNKIQVVKNMVSPELICQMAKGEAIEMDEGKSRVKIATVGRLTIPKNIDGAIDVLKNLVERGIDVEWYVIGDGEERSNLENKIRDLNLEDRFYLLGAKTNPYPYMSKCDIYVQPSKWEGYGITVAEAKVLCKPIVTSDIPEFREQLINNVTGILCENNTMMVDVLIEVIENERLRMSFQKNLSKEIINNDELLKLEELMM